MAYCENCGKELSEGTGFCSACGKATGPAATPVAPAYNAVAEEQEFLDMTHRLLRWERKAWSICGKVWMITGIIFAALFAFLGLALVAIGEELGMVLGTVYLLYAVLFGGMFIGLGIVNKKAADKIPFYLDNLYTNFRLAYDRCGSVGMLVFNAILGTVSPIFFIINFARMKSNRALIAQILARQQNA